VNLRAEVAGLTVAVEDRADEPSLNEEKCDVAIAEATGHEKSQQEVEPLASRAGNSHATRKKRECSITALNDDEGDCRDEADDEEGNHDGRVPLKGSSTSRERYL